MAGRFPSIATGRTANSTMSQPLSWTIIDFPIRTMKTYDEMKLQIEAGAEPVEPAIVESAEPAQKKSAMGIAAQVGAVLLLTVSVCAASLWVISTNRTETTSFTEKSRRSPKSAPPEAIWHQWIFATAPKKKNNQRTIGPVDVAWEPEVDDPFAGDDVISLD